MQNINVKELPIIKQSFAIIKQSFAALSVPLPLPRYSSQAYTVYFLCDSQSGDQPPY